MPIGVRWRSGQQQRLQLCWAAAALVPVTRVSRAFRLASGIRAKRKARHAGQLGRKGPDDPVGEKKCCGAQQKKEGQPVRGLAAGVDQVLSFPTKDERFKPSTLRGWPV